MRFLRALAALFLLLVVAAPVPPNAARAASPLTLVNAFPGVRFDRPLFAAQAPDGSARMFVVEQDGRIWTVPHPAPPAPGVATKTLFLDLSQKVSRGGNEEGLLGLAFHPGFATNRRFFICYSAQPTQAERRRSVIAEMFASAADPTVADPRTERTILSVTQPFANHNGGWLGFDATGKLLVALGDGGSAGDPQGNGQDLGTLLGKILRIDVDVAPPGTYVIPPDNPFVGRPGARGEIFAYGLRNPWRCSIDPVTGELWAGDVGQETFEEVDRIVAGGNYGWSLREGFEPYGSGPAPADPLRDPVTVYDHTIGQSVTGGHVYRGALLEDLAGDYVFADFSTGRIFGIDDPYGAAAVTQLLNTNELIASFATDRAGELFICSFNGRVMQLRDDEGLPPLTSLPDTLSETGVFADMTKLRPAPRALRYSPRSALWSDGAEKSRFLLLPRDVPLAFDAEDAFVLPLGGYAVKTFARNGERLETRVILRTPDGFEAASYRWRADRSEADRIDLRTDVASAGGGPWSFPGTDDCRLCHTDSAGFLLGVTARQIPEDTLRRWRARGAVTGGPPADRIARNAPLRSAAPLAVRARSYLDANCSSCHRADDPTNAGIDLRAAVPLFSTGVLDELPQHGDLGIDDARIVAPGDPERSTLLARMRTLGEGRMPQLATHVVDEAAARVIERWIRSLGK